MYVNRQTKERDKVLHRDREKGEGGRQSKKETERGWSG
jgi:hypothetical protein